MSPAVSGEADGTEEEERHSHTGRWTDARVAGKLAIRINVVVNVVVANFHLVQLYDVEYKELSIQNLIVSLVFDYQVVFKIKRGKKA